MERDRRALESYYLSYRSLRTHGRAERPNYVGTPVFVGGGGRVAHRATTGRGPMHLDTSRRVAEAIDRRHHQRCTQWAGYPAGLILPGGGKQAIRLCRRSSGRKIRHQGSAPAIGYPSLCRPLTRLLRKRTSDNGPAHHIGVSRRGSH